MKLTFVPPSAGQRLGWGQGHLQGIKMIWEQGTPFKGLMEYKRIKVNKGEMYLDRSEQRQNVK